jgi:YidC/Oxa1 family membrane protein insertase
MSKQTAQVNPQQQMIMKIMPLMFFVFAVNVPLAVIVYWVTTNFWSVGQQFILLRNAPTPAGEAAEPAPAGAAALVDNGEERKGLGPLSMFRGLSQSRSTASEPSPTPNKNGNKNADKNAKAGEGKASPKQGGPAPKGTQARSGQTGRQGAGGNRRSGSRSSGKGKSSGPRRGKR